MTPEIEAELKEIAMMYLEEMITGSDCADRFLFTMMPLMQ